MGIFKDTVKRSPVTIETGMGEYITENPRGLEAKLKEHPLASADTQRVILDSANLISYSPLKAMAKKRGTTVALAAIGVPAGIATIVGTAGSLDPDHIGQFAPAVVNQFRDWAGYEALQMSAKEVNNILWKGGALITGITGVTALGSLRASYRFFTDSTKRVEDGTMPVPYTGHFVGIGMPDDLALTKIDGKSFIRHLRDEFSNIVYVREENLPYSRSDPDQTDMVINMRSIFGTSTPSPGYQAFILAVDSKAHGANGALIRQERELFEPATDESLQTMQMALNGVEVQQDLRDLVYEKAVDPVVLTIASLYDRNTVGLIQRNRDLGRNGLSGIIDQEYEAARGIVDAIIDNGLQDKPISVYVADGPNQHERLAWARDYIAQALSEKGLDVDLGYTPSKEGVTIVIPTGDALDDIAAAKQVSGHVIVPSRDQLGLYTKDDKVTPVMYNERIARQALGLIQEHKKLLCGDLSEPENPYNMKVLVDAGTFK